MDSGEVVMIFAGYERAMRSWMDANAGLYRRIAKQFVFADYSAVELARIVLLKLEDIRFTPGPSATPDTLAQLIGSAPREMRSLMNGGMADQLVKLAKENLDQRLPADCDTADLCTVSFADFDAALARMRTQWSATHLATSGNAMHLATSGLPPVKGGGKGRTSGR
eukprot:5892261-Prymnesium_polylepis.1